ncbi:unnamed protein product [Clonostachys rosea f. rosea IK726]|jgi:hypothetical protein|uniref:Uncharacterized protein n=1 Tax=Clonostachys rosea f. rosea IK726 TaxID=1349383 RepID=A0ACA9TZI7_BIOOC|nr:unnamed protein product [Clonostachys rosea f. rosea IK726]
MKPGINKKGKSAKATPAAIEPAADANPTQLETSEASNPQKRPEKPNFQERRHYYGPMDYKLVARTSDIEFDKTRAKTKGEMAVDPAGHPYFVIFWNGRGANSLQLLVRKALSPLEIVKLEAVQTGSADQAITDWPVVVCATVKKNSAKWEQAVDAALKAKDILDGWDFETIQCEIREEK